MTREGDMHPTGFGPLFDPKPPRGPQPPIWNRLRPYVNLGDRGHQSMRIEFARLPLELSWEAQRTIASCVSCGDGVLPFRARNKITTEDTREGFDPSATSLYYAPTCQQKIRQGCCRGKAVTAHFKYLLNWIHSTKEE